ILKVLLRHFKNAGVNKVIIAVNHLRHLIEAFFGDGSKYGLNITYSIEDRPLGTAGPLGLLIDSLDDHFIVTNGDLLTDMNISTLVSEHFNLEADATVASYNRKLKSEFGILEVDDTNKMIGYLEKPTTCHLVSMGLYVLKKSSIVAYLDPGQYLDIPVLMQSMVKDSKAVRCHIQDCLWLDIGRPEDFAHAQTLFEDNPRLFIG
uniref:sugar phosphate nucleotidyltransferase n=1 Tax=Methylobacterium sp. B34 TaxID=95563 RepID=UPI0016513AD9